jgi:hypothetical protein
VVVRRVADLHVVAEHACGDDPALGRRHRARHCPRSRNIPRSGTSLAARHDS